MNVTITGGTGFIGRKLVDRLIADNHNVHIVGRTPKKGVHPNILFSLWDADSAEPPAESLEGADAIIHLAGEPVAQRWTPETKRRIRDSRVNGTRRLVEALSKLGKRPSVLVAASAIGYYGSRGDEELNEQSAPGKGFLPDVCREWEDASGPAASLGLRVVKLRIGVVLGTEGGALAQMLTPFKFGVGGKVGSGRQWMSWIHIEDVVNLVRYALQKDGFEGPVNATAPKPARNSDFTRALARVLRRPAIFPVPEKVLSILFGEMSEMLTGSQRVLPKAAEAGGYKFEFPGLGPALKNLLS